MRLSDVIELVKGIIGELEKWCNKYLPQNAQNGKIELVDIVCDKPLKSFIEWLEWQKHQAEANQVKAKCTKILRWAQTTDGVLSRNPDENPFEANEKEIDLQLANVLRDILRILTNSGKKIAEQDAKRTIAAILISLIMILLFELFVYFGPVTWFRNHPHSYGIQGSIICLILCLIFGIFKPRWRKWYWGAAIAFLVGLVSLL
jgi:hypothetical protein